MSKFVLRARKSSFKWENLPKRKLAFFYE